jgi:hypothetical protein
VEHRQHISTPTVLKTGSNLHVHECKAFQVVVGQHVDEECPFRRGSLNLWRNHQAAKKYS